MHIMISQLMMLVLVLVRDSGDEFHGPEGTLVLHHVWKLDDCDITQIQSIHRHSTPIAAVQWILQASWLCQVCVCIS